MVLIPRNEVVEDETDVENAWSLLRFPIRLAALLIKCRKTILLLPNFSCDIKIHNNALSGHPHRMLWGSGLQ